MLCDGMGALTRTLHAYDGLPGVVVEVDATVGTASEPLGAESIALTPLSCGVVDTITWQTFAGTVRTRPSRLGQETWNGQAADGWIRWSCDDRVIDVAHRMRERTSMAFAPLRNDQGATTIAPLGTLWGRHAVA